MMTHGKSDAVSRRINGGTAFAPSVSGGAAIRRMLKAVAMLFLLEVALGKSLHAQSLDYQYTQNTADGTLRSHARVDPSTLGMSFQLPMGGYTGRGGSSLPVMLYYNSKVWAVNYAFTKEPVQSSSEQQIVPPPGETYTVLDSAYGQHSVQGWICSLSAPHIEWIGYINETYEFGKAKPCVPPPTDKPCEYISRIRVYMPDGSSHELRKDDLARDARSGPDFAGTFYSVDGSRMKFDADANVMLMPDGGRYVFSPRSFNEQTAIQYIDRNGNVLSYNQSTRQWTDSIGRVIDALLPVEPAMGGQNYAYDPNRIAVGDTLYTLPGVEGAPISFHLIWKRLADSLTISAPLRYRGDFALNEIDNPPLPGPFLFTSLASNRIAVEDQLFDPVVLAEVRLPNGLSYKFTYNVYGEIDKIVYPTGGYERFIYDQIPGLAYLTPIYAQTNRGVVDHFISPGGSGLDEIHWQYSVAATSPYTVAQIAPDGTRTERLLHPGRDNLSIKFGFDDARTGMAYEERVYEYSGGPMLRRTLTKWTFDGPTPGGDATAMRNQRIDRQVEILLDTGGDALTNTTTYDYDLQLNLIRTNRYGFASLSQTTAQTGDMSVIPAGVLIRTEETDYVATSAYLNRQLIGLPSETRVKDAGGLTVARTEIFYDEGAYPVLSYGSSFSGWSDPATTARGNPTTTRRWVEVAGPFIDTHTQYDQFGNPRKSWDGRCNLTEIEYSSLFEYAFPTLTRTPAPDADGNCASVSTTGFATNYDFDFTTGLATSMTDPNGVITKFYYDDPFNRLSQVVRADNVPATRNQTSVFYDDMNHQVTTTRDRDAFGDNVLKNIVIYDGLGRTIETRIYETATSYITTVRNYDSMGRVRQTSNPYRPNAVPPELQLMTTAAYDALGRVLSITTPDNAVVATAYAGNRVLVTDQAGKQRISVTDAVGRLIEVWEVTETDSATLGLSFTNHPEVLAGYRTSYGYDALDNLTDVTQRIGAAGTQQTRIFVYDSLSRLKQAMNPESGSINYTYDENSNLKTRVDARGITTNYSYDGLNRVTNRKYLQDPESTPEVSYSYDQPSVSYSLGRLTSVANSVSTYDYLEYDALGRIKHSRQTTVVDGIEHGYTMGYGYDLAGEMTSETYDSGRTISTTFDAAGRISGITGQKTGEAAKTYASQFSYSAHGAVVSLQLGNLMWEHLTFNSRLQPTHIGLGENAQDSSVLQLDYEYGVLVNGTLDVTKNNGNVQSESIKVDSTLIKQFYTYDALNRLISTREDLNGIARWMQTYSYDRYGNRTSLANSGVDGVLLPTNMTPSIDPLTNRINESGGYQYDFAGNLKQEPGKGLSDYDGENRMVAFNAGAAEYGYDGEGHRVFKKDNSQSPSVTTVFVYNVSGQLIAEYTTDQVSTSGTSYLTTDHLGSTRVVTGTPDPGGNVPVKARYDYLPFGEELNTGVSGRTAGMGYGGADSTRQKFTQKERDIESGLDYFLARYYSSAQGRFTSTDPIALAASRLKDPQQINQYAYVRNNPLSLVDPNGEDTIETNVEEYSFTIEREGKDKKGRTWRFSAKITVTERTVTRKDDDGNLIQRNTTATAKAENTDRAINQLSTTQLETVGQVASTIAETAAQNHFDRNVGFAIAQRETFFGANPPGSSSPYMNPAINPMQLTPNQFSDRRLQPSTDLSSNIFLSFLLFTQKAQGRSLGDAFQRYGPGAGNAGGAAYGQDVSSKYNGINAETGGSIRTTNFLPRYDCCSRKFPNYTRQQ
jgi:RHS repeat-associated protein